MKRCRSRASQGPASELGLADRLYAAQLKLAAISPAAAPGVSRIGSRLHIDPVGWYKRPLVASHLPSVAEAVWEQKRLSIHYAGWGKRERMLLVEPSGLCLKAGDWYKL